MSWQITKQYIDRLVGNCKRYSNLHLLVLPNLFFDEKMMDYLLQKIEEEDIRQLDVRAMTKCGGYTEAFLGLMFKNLILNCRLHTLYFGRVPSSIYLLISDTIFNYNFSLTKCEGATIISFHDDNQLKAEIIERNKKCLKRVNKSIITFLCICKYSHLRLDKDTSSIIAKLVWRTRNNKVWAE